MKAVLSVDVAKGKSMVMLSTEYGEVLIEPKEIKHNLKDFDELKNQINSFKLEDLTIFMESTGIYHLPVERYFKENNFNTLVINSLTTKNNYDTLRKTPEFEEIFKGSRIYEETALNFIKTFPHAYIVKEKRIDALYNNLYKTNSGHDYYYKRLANRIKEISLNSYPGVDKDHSDVKNLSDMASILQENIKTINELKNKMIETAKGSPYFDIINSFYGIGEVLTTKLLGELGDITRFDNHKQLIAFCGLDPTIIQSGKSINVHGTISKRGNKYARWILFNISQMVVKLGHQCPNHPVYNYYLTKKAEGKHYYESLTACSTKILRMLYTMCKNNTTFKIN